MKSQLIKTKTHLAAVISVLCTCGAAYSGTVYSGTALAENLVADTQQELNYRHQATKSVTNITAKNDNVIKRKGSKVSSEPHVQKDAQGRYVIDTLMVLTPDAQREILDNGSSLNEYLAWRIEALNKTLIRSKIENSVVRLVGYHVLTEDDFARTGTYPNGPLANIAAAPMWLSTYRDAYGADKVMLIGASNEPNNNAAYGGGDFSSYFVQFLPVEHEFGHMMGGSHCNEGKLHQLNFGFPLVGYSADGHVNGDSFAGTRMCGNNVAFYSNPDIELTLDQIEQYVIQGLMPQGDYKPLLDSNGKLKMGDENYANFAQVWRDNAEFAANRRVATKPILGENLYYTDDNCVGLYSEPNYQGSHTQVCLGSTTYLNTLTVKSVLIGKNVQVNLYSDTDFGKGSLCGGELMPTAFSIGNLAQLSNARGYSGFENSLGSILVYDKDDHVSHFHHQRDFEYASTGKFEPKCLVNNDDAVEDKHNLTLMADNIDWSGSAALYKSEVNIPFSVSFKVRIGHNGPRFNGEGFSFFFANDNSVYQNQTMDWNDIGFIRDGIGYSVEFHDVLNGIYLLDGNGNKLSSITSHDVYTSGQWVDVSIVVNSNYIEVLYDGEQVINQAHQFDTSYAGIGFGAGTGYYTSEIALTDIRIVEQQCLDLAEYDPRVIYTAGDKVLFAGDVYQARWWNIAQIPSEHSGQWRVWEKLGSCI